MAQPGGRPPAPGDLALVQSFINTNYDLEGPRGVDLFATPQGLREWLERRDLLRGRRVRFGPAEVRRAVAVREGLRELIRTKGTDGSAQRAAIGRINAAARGAVPEVRFARNGPQFIAGSGAGLEGALGVVLAIAASAMRDGSWSRLKICPGEHCGWAFYDHSRNLSGRWCSMNVCGGRAKARAHYRRRRGGRG